MKLPVQLTIPSPCAQSWQEMTPDARGRFCNHCRKSVIDFTEWSDKALYSFFENRNENVCGRFFQSQLNRPLQLPLQRHTKLYQLAVALGLSLILLPSSHIHARPRPPMMEQNTFMQQDSAKSAGHKDSITISGTVLDGQKQPVITALVQLLKNGIPIRITQTDIDGAYSIAIDSATQATYSLVFSYPEYKKVTIPVTDRRQHINVRFESEGTLLGEMVIIRHYTYPMVNMEHPGGNRHISAEQISRMP
ncbi:carboxypeptidase-like regulatory domain-containing protein [Chitinophagaceae bacterium MMS25-I14]